MDNLTRATIRLMARRTHTALTDTHWRVLEYAHAYYAQHRVGPLYRNLERHTGVSREVLVRLFPHALQSVYGWVGIPIHFSDMPCKFAVPIQADDHREVFLDHNATTYLRDEVREALRGFLDDTGSFGNPSSSNLLARRAYEVITQARSRVAHTLAVDPGEIIFTSGGSEANNLAIQGVAYRHLSRPGHLITSLTEHSSVLETVQWLEGLGFTASYLAVDREGIVPVEAVRAALRPDTRLVAIMAANNEIGTINPIAEIGALCQSAEIPLMVDAVQAFGKIPLHPRAWGISLLSLSGHKLYGPKGIGALYVAKNQPLTPSIHGGEQEGGRRAGTENVMGILGLGLAAKLACRERVQEGERLSRLRDSLLTRLRAVEPELIVNGSLTQRLPNNLNVGFPDIDSGSLLLSLNQIGVSVSAGSACHAGSVEASHVIRALGVDTERYGIIRFSLGLRTTAADLDYLLTYLPRILAKLRDSSSSPHRIE